jgi:hypothetical protein
MSVDEWYDILPRLRNKQLVWWAQCNTLFSIVSERNMQQARWKKLGLRQCAANGDLPGIRYLVERCGADVHTEDELVLRLASKYGHMQLVRYLVETGKADVHALNERALRDASWYGQLEVVKYLVEKGACALRGGLCTARGKHEWSYKRGQVRCIGGRSECHK